MYITYHFTKIHIVYVHQIPFHKKINRDLNQDTPFSPKIRLGSLDLSSRHRTHQPNTPSHPHLLCHQPNCHTKCISLHTKSPQVAPSSPSIHIVESLQRVRYIRFYLIEVKTSLQGVCTVFCVVYWCIVRLIDMLFVDDVCCVWLAESGEMCAKLSFDEADAVSIISSRRCRSTT